MLGLNELGSGNLYQSEKSIIQKYLYKMDDFTTDFRYLHDELADRAEESSHNLENLPQLMC